MFGVTSPTPGKYSIIPVPIRNSTLGLQKYIQQNAIFLLDNKMPLFNYMDEGHYADWHFSESHYADCHFSDCHYAVIVFMLASKDRVPRNIVPNYYFFYIVLCP
jgi:hypothetical protein